MSYDLTLSFLFFDSCLRGLGVLLFFMKNALKIFSKSTVILSLFLVLLVTACGQEEIPMPDKPIFTDEEPTVAQIQQVVERAAPKAVSFKMKAISPNTGKSPRYAYDASQIKYDKQTQTVKVPLTITWSAKKTELSSTRKDCKIEGNLSISFVNRVAGSLSATYLPLTANDWLKECLKYYGTSETEALKAITFDPY